MAQRWIQKDDMLFRVSNTTSHAIIAGNRRINPGKYALVPARHIVGNIDQCIALATLVSRGHATVFPKYDDLNYNGGLNGSGVSAAYIKSLQAPTAGPFGYAYSDVLPDVNDVPEGWQGYDPTGDTIEYSDGTAYLSVTGV